MSETKKHREFWIKPAYRPEDEDRISFCKVPRNDFEHVIEYSALLEEKQKVKELVNGLRALAKNVPVNYFEPQYLKDAYELIKKHGDV